MLVMAVAEEERSLWSDVHPLCVPSRVQFRADVLQQRREEREVQELARQKKEEEKRKHLEALRNQVDCYLLLTFSTTLIFSVSRNDPHGGDLYSSGLRHCCHPVALSKKTIICQYIK